VGVTRIESNRNRHFGLKIESKSIENRNLEIVTSLSETTSSDSNTLLRMVNGKHANVTQLTFCLPTTSRTQRYICSL